MTEYQYPHCNTEVLHAPGACRYCDEFPDRQAARKASNTPFTPDQANGWMGNVAVPISNWEPPYYWDDEDIAHWKSLDHTFCTMINFGSGKPAYELCQSTHCLQCGKSTSSQGHLDRNYECPTPVEDRKPWP